MNDQKNEVGMLRFEPDATPSFSVRAQRNSPQDLLEAYNKIPVQQAHMMLPGLLSFRHFSSPPLHDKQDLY